jgi:hypothetical protein
MPLPSLCSDISPLSTENVDSVRLGLYQAIPYSGRAIFLFRGRIRLRGRTADAINLLRRRIRIARGLGSAAIARFAGSVAVLTEWVADLSGSGSRRRCTRRCSLVQTSDSLPYGVLRQLRQAVEIQLGHDVTTVGLDRLHTAVELGGDLFGRCAFGNKL